MGSLSENAMMPARRFPRGKRGLKLTVGGWQRCAGGSLPSREAWIEIPATLFGGTWVASLPSREAWIEIVHLFVIKSVGYPSLPSREAWIEICQLLSEALAEEKSLPSREAWIEIL